VTNTAVQLFYTYSDILPTYFITLKYVYTSSLPFLHDYIGIVDVFNTHSSYLDNLIYSLGIDINFILNTTISSTANKWLGNFLFTLDNNNLPFITSSLDLLYIKLDILKEHSYTSSSYSVKLLNSNIIESVPNLMINILETITLLYIIFLAYILISSTYITDTKDTVDHDQMICQAAIQAEKEITNIDDLFPVMFLVFFLFGLYTTQMLVAQVMGYLVVPELIFVSFYTFLGLVLLNISLLLVDLGIWFPVFIRGTSKTNSFLYETITDLLTTTTFFLRTAIQCIRVVVIYLFYTVYISGLEEQNPEILFFNSFSPTYLHSYTINSHSYDTAITAVVTMMRMLFEVCHFLLIAITQVLSFIMIVFWIFNTLYFTYEANVSEKLFSIKRQEKKFN